MNIKNDEFEEYRKTLANSDGYNPPTVCISIFQNKLIFTTKKVGSRYFEDISAIRDESESTSNDRRSIDFQLIFNSESSRSMPDYDDRLNFDKYYFKVAPHSLLSQDNFFDIVGIKKISDLFNESTQKNWEYIFIVRDPLKRTLTGFCEIADSYFANSMLYSYSRNIVQKHFQIVLGPSPNVSFKDLPIEKVVEILNEYSGYIGTDLVRDEHTSAWCIFLRSFIIDHNLSKKIKIIDLEDKSAMSIFPKLTQPSNKGYLKEWMDISNRFYVENLIKSIDFFLIPETEAYKELLQLK
jgi:hypothetical protein